MKRTDLPRGVFPKGRWYYLVSANGKKRIWTKLSLIKDGLPALYTALAEVKAKAAGAYRMPALISDWEREVMPVHSPKWQENEKARGRVIAEAFDAFAPDDVETPDCSEFLGQFSDKPRTYNAYRSQLREYFRYAEEKGRRKAGTNPIAAIRTKATPPRQRCPTTSELRRVKIGCIRGDDGRPTRSGMTMACLIELAYLSGQDVGVMIRLLDKRDPDSPDEPHVCDAGIFFRRDKTGGAVIIEWTPRLRALVARLRRLKAERQLTKHASRRVETSALFTKQDGQPLTYDAVKSAWQDGIRRSKVKPFMFRDIRARAMTDKEELEGIQEANKMGTHSTESQTADYVRRKKPRRTAATR